MDEEWEGKLQVTQKDFMSALQSLTPSVTPQELAKYRNMNTNIET